MRILQNFSFLALSQVAEKFINFFIIILLAGYLGVNGFGSYALCIAFVNIFTSLLDAGLNMLTMREVAARSINEASFLGRVLISKMIIGSVVAVLIILSAGYLYPTLEIQQSILFYTLSVLLLSLSTAFRAIFMAKERMELEGLLATGYRLLLLAGVFVCMFMNIRLPELMLIHLFSSAIILAVSFIVCTKYFTKIIYSINLREMRSLLTNSFPFALGAIMGEIYFNIDRVMLSKICGVDAVGYYSVASRLCFFWIVIAHSLTLASYPVFSRSWNVDKKAVVKMFNSLFKTLLVISVPLSLVVYATAGEIVGFTFGENFDESIDLLKILAWLLPPLYLIHLTGRTLEAIGEQGFVAKSMTISVIINVLLNLALIPRMGAAGACIATVITAIIIFLIQFTYINRRMGGIPVFESITRVFVPLAVFFGVLFL